jgi:hypothetical protein
MAFQGEQISEWVAEKCYPDIMAVPIPDDDVGLGLHFCVVGFQKRDFFLNQSGFAGNLKIDAGIRGSFVGLEHDDVDAAAVEELHRIGHVGGEAKAENIAIEFLGLFEIGAGKADLIDGSEFEGLTGGHFFSGLKGQRRAKTVLLPNFFAKEQFVLKFGPA